MTAAREAPDLWELVPRERMVQCREILGLSFRNDQVAVDGHQYKMASGYRANLSVVVELLKLREQVGHQNCCRWQAKQEEFVKHN